MCKIQRVNSIKNIEKQYGTGDLPVLVFCSDKKAYICKYMRTSGSAYKLLNEYIGATFARAWQIISPRFSFVGIRAEHWANINTPHLVNSVSVGYEKMENVVDITPYSSGDVESNEETLADILFIALFDFWIANEDRTVNNANLLYDVVRKKLISIDYGGIFNTASYDFDLCQLTSTDSILCADVFHHIIDGKSPEYVLETAYKMKGAYQKAIDRCKKEIESVLRGIPLEWNIKDKIVRDQFAKLFSSVWYENTWSNFIDCVKENIHYE